eukprot:6459426-Amphidinium_carterae.2
MPSYMSFVFSALLELQCRAFLWGACWSSLRAAQASCIRAGAVAIESCHSRCPPSCSRGGP